MPKLHDHEHCVWPWLFNQNKNKKKMSNNKFMEIFGDKVLIRETRYLTQSITTNEPNL